MIVDKLSVIINSYDEQSTKYIISQFIKNNINKVPNMSINQIAQSCHTSKSQISKYIQSLGYANMADFKDDCLDFISGIKRTNKESFCLDEDIKSQYISFTNQKLSSLQYTIDHLDMNQLTRFIRDMKDSQRIFVYAHGHARTMCTYIQNELTTKQKETIICDVDFVKNYNFKKNDLLLFISVNGNTFYYDKRVIHHILHSPVNTWLITCKKDLLFSKNYLYVPTNNDEFNDYILRHVIDYFLMY